MGLRLDSDPAKRIRQLERGARGLKDKEDGAMQVASVRQMGPASDRRARGASVPCFR